MARYYFSARIAYQDDASKEPPFHQRVERAVDVYEEIVVGSDDEAKLKAREIIIKEAAAVLRKARYRDAGVSVERAELYFGEKLDVSDLTDIIDII